MLLKLSKSAPLHIQASAMAMVALPAGSDATRPGYAGEHSHAVVPAQFVVPGNVVQSPYSGRQTAAYNRNGIHPLTVCTRARESRKITKYFIFVRILECFSTMGLVKTNRVLEQPQIYNEDGV
ncbi:MAG: hypothetical protein LBC53_05560 [Spirochaetaceae bacterium]|jgi:hypothetical protein|nr:hypothetical protein [Spirochaetaceae bacterium]